MSLSQLPDCPHHLDTRIVGWAPIRGMDICLKIVCACVVLCRCTLSLEQSSLQQVPINIYKKNFESRKKTVIIRPLSSVLPCKEEGDEKEVAN
jgi:hypothetical protein